MQRRKRLVTVVALAAALVATATGCSGQDPAGADRKAKATTSSPSTSVAKAEEPADGAAVASPGCAAAAGAGAGQPVAKERRAVDVGGTARWYLLTVPPSAVDRPAPLVLDFHGLAEGADFHALSSGYNDLAQEKGFVVAFPNGTGQPASWNIAGTGANPDLDFVDALVARLGSDLCLDTSRIYATGLSNGALLSSVLGCTRSSVFAALAPVAGVTFPPDCHPDHPVPIMAFHGTADPILHFNGGVGGDVLSGALAGQAVSTTSQPPPDLNGPGYPDAIAKWAVANGCKGSTDTNVSPTVIHRVWDCPKGAETEFWIVVGGGHTWPGSDALTNPAIARLVGPTTMDISATNESWNFLSHHQRG